MPCGPTAASAATYPLACPVQRWRLTSVTLLPAGGLAGGAAHDHVEPNLANTCLGFFAARSLGTPAGINPARKARRGAGEISISIEHLALWPLQSVF